MKIKNSLVSLLFLMPQNPVGDLNSDGIEETISTRFYQSHTVDYSNLKGDPLYDLDIRIIDGKTDKGVDFKLRGLKKDTYIYTSFPIEPSEYFPFHDKFKDLMIIEDNSLSYFISFDGERYILYKVDVSPQ